jgi:3',5'-cyclic AMP phosphodiesterase CpdA
MPTACRLVHLTDFHLFQPQEASRRAFLNKRLLSYLSWRFLRGAQNSPRILAQAALFLRSRPWDQVVITGDLTHLGLRREFQCAQRYLAHIGSPARVFVIPGNHDAIVPASVAIFPEIWQAYMASDDSLAGVDGTYPAVRIRNGVALIGLSSACPTRPFSATGRLGQRQCRRLATILAQTGRERLFRVLLVHHPILRGQVKFRKRLEDAAMLRAVLREYGAEMVLHGHTHRYEQGKLNGPAAPIPVLGLPSTSAVRSAPAHKQACLRFFSIQPENGGWQVRRIDHRSTPRGFVRDHATTWRTASNTPG